MKSGKCFRYLSFFQVTGLLVNDAIGCRHWVCQVPTHTTDPVFVIMSSLHHTFSGKSDDVMTYPGGVVEVGVGEFSRVPLFFLDGILGGIIWR